MRIGVVVRVGAHPGLSDGLAETVADAEDAGLDVVWLEGGPAPASAGAETLTAAAFVAARTEGIRLVAHVPAGPHPVQIAEQAAVADNVSNGRLLLALGDEGPEPSLLAETAEVVLAAAAPRPFVHRGARWAFPGAVEGNAGEQRISITPKPSQLELPVWLTGRWGPAVGRELGLSHVAGDADSAPAAAEAWAGTEAALGRVAARLRRPAIRRVGCLVGEQLDDSALLASLSDEAAVWGLDMAVLRLPTSLDVSGRRSAIKRIASFVRPHLQMDRIPAHVREYWRRELAARFLE
jgi:alkanesulfonate monooxygenase SsuD/methylene tetrahydromethanopterin reductase-like flavin-dependent oxidoreductase (luciferase family)